MEERRWEDAGKVHCVESRAAEAVLDETEAPSWKRNREGRA